MEFYRLAIPVLRRALETPDVTCWWLVDELPFRSVSYRDLGASVLFWVQQFGNAELPTEPVIATCLPSGIMWASIDLACSILGIIHVAIDPRCDVEQRRRLYDTLDLPCPMIVERECDAIPIDRQIVTGLQSREFLRTVASIDDAQRAREIAGLLRRVELSAGAASADDPAMLLHTSGSTAEPKFAALSHRNLITNAAAKLDAMPQCESDLRVNVLPFAHAYARTCELSTWAISGGAMACVEKPANLAAVFQELQPTLFNGVPKVFDCFARQCRSSSELREIFGPRMRMLASGGAPLRGSTFQRYLDAQLPIHQGYGLTEASPVVCSNRFGQVDSNTVGYPVAGVELQIDETGELQVRGPGVMLGYWNNPEATSRRIREGWLATGDKAIRREDGKWQIVGRVDDQICLSNGYMTSPATCERSIRDQFELEDCLLFVADGELIALLICTNDQQLEGFQTATQIPVLSGELQPHRYIAVSMDDQRLDKLRGFKGNWRRTILPEWFVSHHFSESLFSNEA